LIGFSIAAPVGPIGLLTIQRTLQLGSTRSLATGLGAAAADAIYGQWAFGVTALIDALTAARLPLVIGGGAFLCGWPSASGARRSPTRTAEVPAAPDLLRCFAASR
jgi:threonine/homoserine/homoserine lactone efflux protein